MAEYRTAVKSLPLYHCSHFSAIQPTGMVQVEKIMQMMDKVFHTSTAQVSHNHSSVGSGSNNANKRHLSQMSHTQPEPKTSRALSVNS